MEAASRKKPGQVQAPGPKEPLPHAQHRPRSLAREEKPTCGVPKTAADRLSGLRKGPWLQVRARAFTARVRGGVRLVADCMRQMEDPDAATKAMIASWKAKTYYEVLDVPKVRGGCTAGPFFVPCPVHTASRRTPPPPRSSTPTTASLASACQRRQRAREFVSRFFGPGTTRIRTRSPEPRRSSSWSTRRTRSSATRPSARPTTSTARPAWWTVATKTPST